MKADDAGWDVTFWLDNALSYMAMGNYPYASSYILNGDGILPAFPVRAACAAFDKSDPSFNSIAAAFASSSSSSSSSPAPHVHSMKYSHIKEALSTLMVNKDTAFAWLNRIADFAGVFYNASGTKTCFNVSESVNQESEVVDELWEWQYCTEIFQLFGQTGPPNDIFWAEPWDVNATADECAARYGGDFVSNVGWATQKFGGNYNSWNTTNIVWSNGEYDPWAGGGVKENRSEVALYSITIAEGAHHLDLMWSDPRDTEAVRNARAFEMAQVRNWIDEKKQQKS